jgi:hypothetical protein
MATTRATNRIRMALVAENAECQKKPPGVLSSLSDPEPETSQPFHSLIHP